MLRFGVEIFNSERANFTVIDNLPLADDYVVGVGDEISIQLVGKDSEFVRVMVGREGKIAIPWLGALDVASLKYSDVKTLIEQTVRLKLIGTEALVSLGAPRKINVFAAGEVRSPGNYALSNSTTALQLLFVAGGPTDVGSFRHIIVKRSGKIVATIDLYDLLLEGSLNEDIRLHNGDVLFVPPVKITAEIRGQVVRPARFEVVSGETVRDVLRMAGGLTSEALRNPSVLRSRKQESELPILKNLNLTDSVDLGIEMVDGDLLTVSRLPPRFDNPIIIGGDVDHPGVFAWFEGARISDLIANIEGRLKKTADLEVAVIVRRRKDRLSVDVFDFNLRAALLNKGMAEDPLLLPHDEVIIFSRSLSRSEVLMPLIAKLEAQSSWGERPRVIEVKGAVSSPGKYPLINGHRVSDLIRLAGGAAFLDVNVDMDIGIVVRRSASLAGKLKTIPFRLHEALEGAHSDVDPALEPMDTLLIFNDGLESGESNRQQLLGPIVKKLERQATREERAQVVTVVGQVREPGDYPILGPFGIEHLIKLAGGFAEGAYTKSAEILRMRITAEEISETEKFEVSLAQPVTQKTVLQSRDVLRINQIPGWRRTEFVTMEEEVLFPGTYALLPGERLSEVLSRAGGLSNLGSAEGAIYTNMAARDAQLQQAKQYLGELQRSTLFAKGQNKLNLAVLEESIERELLGRITIDLPGILSGLDVSDPVLQGGDRLHVPIQALHVNVFGEVMKPGSFSFKKGRKTRDYIRMAGDLTTYADAKRIYLIKPNGSVVPLKGRSLLRFDNATKIQPGDAIVVPVNMDHMKPLERVAKISSAAFQTTLSLFALMGVAGVR